MCKFTQIYKEIHEPWCPQTISPPYQSYIQGLENTNSSLELGFKVPRRSKVQKYNSSQLSWPLASQTNAAGECNYFAPLLSQKRHFLYMKDHMKHLYFCYLPSNKTP